MLSHIGTKNSVQKSRRFSPIGGSVQWFVFLPIGIVRLYQWTIRPIIGPHCRFLPHCSEYAIESFKRHGLFSGSWLTAKRLGRCHPWCQGGIDPVPVALKSHNKLLSQQTMID